MIRRLALLTLFATFFALVPRAEAQNAQARARRRFVRPRVDPRRRPVRRQRLTEFQPGNGFVPRPLGAPLPQRRTFWTISRRRAQIDRNGDFQPFGSFRFYNNDVLVERRRSFRRRR